MNSYVQKTYFLHSADDVDIGETDDEDRNNQP